MLKIKTGMLLVLILIILALAGCQPRLFLAADEPVASKILDRDGQLVTLITKENRIPVPLVNISPYMKNAIIAVEDSRFYRHHGIDLEGLLRAMYRNIKAGRVVEGGSTITQQLAKNLFLDPRRTIGRKFEEMLLAIQLESKYTKDEILEMYLNEIYFGEGAYGIEAASRLYFNKSARDLGLAESAMLAGIPRGPSIYNPIRNFEAAKSRQAIVLSRMKELNMISEIQARQAQELYLQPVGNKAAIRNAPFFVNEIVKHFEENYNNGLELLYSGGLSIYTTLDHEMQEAAEKAITERLAGSDPELEGALVALDPRTGEVMALVGGRDYSRSQFNRSLAKNQPGSAFKPFLYAAAIEMGYTAGTTVTCEPVVFPVAGDKPYQPRDFNGDYHNRSFTLKEALFTSDNVVAVKLNQQIGPPVAAAYAKKMGIESELRPVLSLPLGTSEVTPMEMAGAYATLANRGVKTKPYFIQKVVDNNGRILEEHRPQPVRVLDEKTAYIVTDMLTGVLQPGGTAGNLAGIIGRPAAGKTGTTDNFRDAWFVGYTPDLVASVYVGFDDKTRVVGRTGSQVAAPVWANFIGSALQDVPVKEFSVPEGITKVRICKEDGLLAGEYNANVIEAAFIQGTEPVSICPHGWPDLRYLNNIENPDMFPFMRDRNLF